MEIISFLIRTILFLVIVFLLDDWGMWDRVSTIDVIATGLLFMSSYGIGPLRIISIPDYFDAISECDFGDWGDGGCGF